MSTCLEINIFHTWNKIYTKVDVFYHNIRLGKEMQSMFRFDEVPACFSEFAVPSTIKLADRGFEFSV